MTMTETNTTNFAAILEQLGVERKAPAIPYDIAAQARELNDLRAAIKVMEERQKVLRASLLDFLDSEDADSVTDGAVSIARSTHNRSGIDKAMMEALYPKVLAEVETSTPVTQVRVQVK